ncbi:hypothetical protein [Pasteurella canis]|uniref:Outer membrane lopoprotein PlpP n=1 Tax=Pasteurella canis TaxID=753 RepID=A0ABQ4VI51_9PAST|nr:hypothetical protein [Pasteurella canis]UEC22643.1 hypothetical protein K7G93_001366 [Pasteurella canis]GJH43707.1 hypothetical protein PA42_18810 [Pasteurella canis]
MKKSIFKTSLLVTLSTLFVACGSHNHTSVNKETQKQPQQSQKPAPQTKPQANSQDKAPQEKPNNTEQSSSSSMQTENSTQNHSTEAGKEQKPSKPEQPMNTESSADKKDEMRNTDTSKNNPSKNTQSDIPDSMKDNHKPNTQVTPPQIPPKTENPSNSNNISNKDKETQSMRKPVLEEVPQDGIPYPPHQPEIGNWQAKIYDSTGYNYSTELGPKSISGSSGSIISLKLGENKNNQNIYHFILLGESDKGSLYYGYHLYSGQHQGKTIKAYNMFYGMDQNQINSRPLPNAFSAQYKKAKGFLYIPFTDFSNFSTEQHSPQYADINITYKNSKATGKVTKLNDANATLFDITDSGSNSASNYTLTVTPTEQVSNIESNDKAEFNVYFLDAEKNKEERKYITGTGSGKKWAGAFAAEKQDETKLSSSTSIRAE